MEKINQCTYYSHTTIAWWLSTLGVLKPKSAEIAIWTSTNGSYKDLWGQNRVELVQPIFSKNQVEPAQLVFFQKKLCWAGSTWFFFWSPRQGHTHLCRPLRPDFWCQNWVKRTTGWSVQPGSTFFPPFFFPLFYYGLNPKFSGKRGVLAENPYWLWLTAS